MADDDKTSNSDFAEASRNLTKVTGELKDFNQNGKEIAMTIAGDFKKVTDPFVQSFPITSRRYKLLVHVGKTLFNKSFAALKDKREQALLRQRLGLTREQFGHLKKQKAVLDAQEK